ncbi:MAG: hypothetical protein FJY75_11855, partial [Candidatus Eisenbacteria bacterium]|nr:hypothetical protein [Candidatus Eisenbacteria bacterium]
MTARLLIGPAGSGKTRRCLQALRDCERAGEAALLVVPDQFTYAADRLLLEEGSLAGTRHARVISFRRLARMIAAGAEPVTDLISDEGRRLILYPILQSLPATALGPFAPVRLMPGFVAALADAVAEVKGIGGDEAAERLALAAGAGAKAAAFARIVREYDAALAGAGLRDPGDWMRELAADLERRPARWSGLRLWMDGFTSFTPEERALLPPLAAAAREFTITLCADGSEARALLAQARDAADFSADPLSSLLGPRLRSRLRRPQFLPVLRTALWLQQRIAGLAVEAPPEAPLRFGPASELALLEAGLFATAPPDPGSAPAAADPRRPAPRP